MDEFKPLINQSPALTSGLVLRVGRKRYRFMRVTHVFEDCIYVMWVSEPERARYAQRPLRMPRGEVEKLSAIRGSTWGRIELPAALVTVREKGSQKERALEAAWSVLEPLVKYFESEENLRHRFTALIRQHAEAKRVPAITLTRWLLRFYYFGGCKSALLSLPRGTKPGNASYSALISLKSEPKRRGRQGALHNRLGQNNFVVSEQDRQDMVKCLKSCLRKGRTFLTDAHDTYLKATFKRKHPVIYAEYKAKKRMLPVTLRQFRYYIKEDAQIAEALARNLRTYERNQGRIGTVYAKGPGEIYEIDATGGRWHLLRPGNPPVLLGKPWIYLVIDRWSRFIPAVYITLKSPSYEEVRHVIYYSFTSREPFKALNVDIDDERLPRGSMCIQWCHDQGAEFMCKSIEAGIVGQLKMILLTLPPRCPDGKAIIERYIRELKHRMAASGMKGVFADRPLDWDSKKAERKAEEAATHSLAEAYRALIEEVIKHNNRPHKALRRMRILTQNGVPPTPQQAYLWGLKNISGLQPAPFTEEELRCRLLSVDKASIANGVLRYRQRAYMPINEAAHQIASTSTKRSKQISVRVDKGLGAPADVEIPRMRGEWAKFHITEGDAMEMQGVTLMEEEALSSENLEMWSEAENDARLERLNADSGTHRGSRQNRQGPVRVSKAEKSALRKLETARQNAVLGGRKSPNRPPAPTESSSGEQWKSDEAQEVERQLQIIRSHREKSRK